jgi:hypothetical protein
MDMDIDDNYIFGNIGQDMSVRFQMSALEARSFAVALDMAANSAERKI